MSRSSIPNRMKVVCWAVLSVFTATQCVLPALAAAQDSTAVTPGTIKVQLPVGTVVDLTFDTMVTPQTAAVGQNVTLKVANDVKVNGKVVIAAGTTATGEVIQSKKSGSVGQEAEISVTVKHVAAVDGTVVPLSGTKAVVGANKQTTSIVITLLCCILGLLKKGGKAEIPAGSSLRATVAAPVEIQVAK
jgi:hypothetical protein